MCRTKAYDGGGEENLTFQGTYCNNGGGLDIDTGIFTCPVGGTYMFQVKISIRMTWTTLIIITMSTILITVEMKNADYYRFNFISYFQFHIATHDNKKALLSIRRNGDEVASIFDQNHKDNHKNSMAGQNIIMDVKRGDEIVVYAYTGTWLADFPMNHYTHWVGLLLKPSQEEVRVVIGIGIVIPIVIIIVIFTVVVIVIFINIVIPILIIKVIVISIVPFIVLLIISNNLITIIRLIFLSLAPFSSSLQFSLLSKRSISSSSSSFICFRLTR